jgi:hypothetical protein
MVNLQKVNLLKTQPEQEMTEKCFWLVDFLEVDHLS